MSVTKNLYSMNYLLKNKYLILKLAGVLGLNFLVLMKIPYLSNLLGFVFLFILPGLLIYRLFEINEKGIWYQLVNIFGLSISYVIFIGLLTNFLDTLFLVPHPLIPENVSLFLTIVMMVFIYYLDKKNLSIIGPLDLNKIKSVLHYTPFIFLTVVSVAGTTLLNNGGTNLLVIFSIIVICALCLFLLVRSEKLSDNFILTTLYFISLSLLLLTSMRGVHVIGYDVNKELRVFGITQSDHFWSMAKFRDAYNACLSITILPTIASGFISISNEYVYKFLFQLFFALMPVTLFLFLRNFCEKNITLLAVYFCIFQTWFFQNMPALVRQEFAILFFVLMFTVIFDKDLTKFKQFILFSIYGLAMVLSHYSTTYVSIVILLGGYSINMLFNFSKSIFSNYEYRLRTTNNIKLKYIVFLVLAVLVWGKFVTNTSGNINEFLYKSTVSASNILTTDNLIQTVNKLLYPPKEKTDLESYINNQTKYYKENNPQFTYYETGGEDSQIMNTNFAEVEPKINPIAKEIALSLFKYLKIISNDIFILFGIGLLLYEWFRAKNDHSELISLAIVGVLFIFMLIIIPGALHEYNLERLYFQLLIIWSLFGVIGGIKILKFIFDEKKAVYIIFGIYALIFMFYTGVVFFITGGPATISINNYGEDYEKFYTSSQEASAATWLGNNYFESPVFATSVGINKLNAFSLIDTRNVSRDTLPTIIPKEAFVFLTRMNSIEKVGIYEFNGNEYVYTFPNQFLNTHKDKVYSNGVSEIYR